MPRSTTSRSCWRRPEATARGERIAVHLLRFRPGCGPGPRSRWLTPRERKLFESLKEPRRTEWWASRVAAKESLRRLTGGGVAPIEIEIEKGPLGAPASRVSGRRISVSLSHAEGCAAGASATGGRVGVDVESLRPLPPAFSRYFLHPREEELLRSWDDPLTALLAAWTLKEAVLKAFGVGLTVPPKAVVVTRFESTGRVAARVGGKDVGAAIWRDDWVVVAVAIVAPARFPAMTVSHGDLR